MIDVDQEIALQALQAGAGQAVTLEDHCRVVAAVHMSGMDDALGMGKRPVDNGNRVAEDDVGALAHEAQDLGQRERGAYSVAIGTVV